AKVPLPASVPFAPLAAPPSAELRSIDNTAFTVLKHAIASTRSTRVNSQRFHSARRRIDPKCTVAHDECSITPCKFFQPIGNVHVSAIRPVLRAQNHELSFIAVPVCASVSPSVAAAVSTTLPAAAPSLSPITSAPSAEHRSINDAAFTIFEHAFASIRSASINAKCLHPSRIGINAKRAVPHHEGPVRAGQLFQSISDVNMTGVGPILSSENLILSRITLVILS